MSEKESDASNLLLRSVIVSSCKSVGENNVSDSVVDTTAPTIVDNNCGDDEVPVGTPREERLARKLKVIDVLSPKSSIDVAELDDIESLPVLPNQSASFTPLNSPTATVCSGGSIMATAASIPNQQQPDSFNEPPQRRTIKNSATYNANFCQNTCRAPNFQPINNSSLNSLNPSLPNRVTLLVGGTRFVVNPQTFTRQPNTMLGR